jgi:hypothetical protein
LDEKSYNADYKIKIVAFIDVLGFSALVLSNLESSKKTIDTYFSYVIGEFEKEILLYDFEYYLISDSIVIHTLNTKENFEKLTRTVAKLQTKLISKGIIVRGGISVENLHVSAKENVIVGPALVIAYNLEETKAIYPRVVIDRKIIRGFYDSISQMCIKNPMIRLSPPAPYMEDLPYIDFTPKLSTVMQVGRLDAVKKLLEKQLLLNTNIEKYLWLYAHIIEAFEAQKIIVEEKLQHFIAEKGHQKLNKKEKTRKTRMLLRIRYIGTFLHDLRNI